jgi:error-prone DNA polymerase
VPLWVKSNYSFLEGASHPDEYVEEAQTLGLRAVALTDRDGVPGIVRAWAKARALGVKLLTGSEVTLHDGTTLTLLAMNRAGYASLCRLVTAGRLRSPKGQCRVGWGEVAARAVPVVAQVADPPPHFRPLTSLDLR